MSNNKRGGEGNEGEQQQVEKVRGGGDRKHGKAWLRPGRAHARS